MKAPQEMPPARASPEMKGEMHGEMPGGTESTEAAPEVGWQVERRESDAPGAAPSPEPSGSGVWSEADLRNGL